VPPEPAAELDRLNEAADQAIAVGDSENDIPMLGVVGFSICIGANPSCRAPASMSVATALEALDLIDVRIRAA